MIRFSALALALALLFLSPGLADAGIKGVARDLQNKGLPGLDIAIYDANDNLLDTRQTGPDGSIDIPEIPNRPPVNPDKPLVIKVVFSGTSLGFRRQRVSLQPLDGDRDHVIAVIVPKEDAPATLSLPPGGHPSPSGPMAAPAYYLAPTAAYCPAPYPVVAAPRPRGHGLFRHR